MRGTVRILLVEDNVDLAVSTAMLLELSGAHQVSIAYTGQQALEVAAAHPPDAMLVDIGLPDMDGYQLCGRIRRESFGGGMLLVAVTAYGRPEDIQRAFAAGFDAHRLKPTDVNDLAAVLQEWSTQRANIDGKP
jgi:CheY-like chemotaxis protein